MKKINIFLIFITIFISCNDTEQENNVTNKPSLNRNFTKTFEGLIDGKYVIYAKLTSEEGYVSGHYFYKSNGINLRLSGDIDTSGNIVLNEFNDKGNQTGIFKGKIINFSTSQFGGESYSIKGDWTKPDGSVYFKFSMSETDKDYDYLRKNINKNRNSKYDGEYVPEEYYDCSIKIKTLENNRFKYYGRCLIESPSYATIKGEGTIKNNIGYSDDKTVIIKFHNNYIDVEYTEATSGEFNERFVKENN